MTGVTAVHRALECIAEEWQMIAEREAALEAFARRVRSIPAEQPNVIHSGHAATPTATVTHAIQARGAAPSASADRCVAVKTAFDETIGAHSAGSAEDTSRFEAMTATLSNEIADALATDAGWTPPLKAAVLQAVSTSRRDLAVRRDHLQEERSTLEATIATIDEIVDWLQAMADKSLLQCSFDALQTNHEQLETYRTRLETRLNRRQAQLTGSTTRDRPSGTRYRSIVTSIYASGPTQYPILSTAIRLYGICGGCQRSVRAQLVRRV